MKRRLIIAAVALAVAAIAAVVYFVVRGENPHFGYADEVFVLPSEVGIKLEGDTHLVTGDTLTLDPNMLCGYTTLRSVDERVYVRKNGDDVYGIIERLGENGKWEYFSELFSGYMITSATPKYSYIDAEGSLYHYVLPQHLPGEYRVTEYFREQFTTVNGGIVIGDEVYSVSWRLSVPEPSGKKFDVFVAGILGSVVHGAMLQVGIRANDGVVPYIDREYVDLEMYEDGRWRDVEESRYDRGYSEKYRFSRDASHVYFVFRETEGSEDEPTATVFASGHFYPEDYGALHRVTLRFTENEDGSGRKYYLTLKFRWDYED